MVETVSNKYLMSPSMSWCGRRGRCSRHREPVVFLVVQRIIGCSGNCGVWFGVVSDSHVVVNFLRDSKLIN